MIFIRYIFILTCLTLILPSFSESANIPKPIRAFHFILRAVPLDKAYWMADEAKKAGFNVIIVQITDGVKLEKAPWLPHNGAWSKEEFSKWVEYVRGIGMEFIPEIKFLTHQEKFFQRNNLDLMFNSRTYDPQKDEVYQKVFAIIDEIVELCHPKAFHIGHDEVAGFSPVSKEKWLNPDEKILPAELFYKDIMKIYNYLKNKGIETWMWGDMLISPDEFSGLPAESLKAFHGTLPGYGKELRAKLPKDIVICDWHYNDDREDFPSLSIMQKEGFRVIGATWAKEKTIKNFSKYASKSKAYGMMATTWWHVQKRNWDVVEKIIKVSGQYFLNDFPDEK
jgi:hypothetical protein